MEAKLEAYLRQFPDKYPQRFARRYPHLFSRIGELWGGDALDALFSELLVADREDRQGFTPEIAAEIFVLSQLHEHYRNEAHDDEDVWAQERKMTREESEIFIRDLQRRGMDFTPKYLFVAVEQGDSALVKDFIRAGMDVDIQRMDEWTPLMVALFNGHEDTAMLLLAYGANVRAKAKRGYEPIHWAALNGYNRAIDFILMKGGDPNAETEYGWTPLLQAATRGHIDIVRKLIERGARVNAVEHEGWSPLHKACANGHLQTARLLIERGGYVDIQSNTGVTPLALAKKSGNPLLVEMLMAHLSV